MRTWLDQEEILCPRRPLLLGHSPLAISKEARACPFPVIDSRRARDWLDALQESFLCAEPYDAVYSTGNKGITCMGASFSTLVIAVLGIPCPKNFQLQRAEEEEEEQEEYE